MNILAINTCFNQTYVGVESNNNQVYNTMNSSLKQSENILGLVNKSLNEANISLNQIDYLACVIGPGSFTGIRIGASLCIGFAMANKNIKKIEICSLDLVAFSFVKQHKPKTSFTVLLNALSGNLYACNFDKYGNRNSDPSLVKSNSTEFYCETIVGIDEENLDMCNCNVSLNSEDLLEYTQVMIINGKISNTFQPLYIRKSQAEENLQ